MLSIGVILTMSLINCANVIGDKLSFTSIKKDLFEGAAFNIYEMNMRTFMNKNISINIARSLQRNNFQSEPMFGNRYKEKLLRAIIEIFIFRKHKTQIAQNKSNRTI